MENYTRESLRDLYYERSKPKGSAIWTLVIIAIFAFACIFYVKTSKPDLYQKAVSCINEVITEIAPPKEETSQTQTLSDDVDLSSPIIL